VRIRFHLLRTEHRRCGEVFVNCRQEFNVVFVEKRFRAPELLVEAAERRSPVAADESRRVEPGGTIHRPLHQRNTHQRLRAREEDTAGFAPVAVEQLVVVEREGRAQVFGGHTHGEKTNSFISNIVAETGPDQ
jgi:hypothetical protein